MTYCTSCGLLMRCVLVCNIARTNLNFSFEPFGLDHVTIAAIIGEERITVSGNPYHLNSFTKLLPEEVVVCPINVNTLYHRADLDVVRHAVLIDITSRDIHFPVLTDIMTPIRSTFDGELISNNDQGPNTLVERVVDMVLIHPVKWDILVERSAANFAEESIIKFLNIGLGPSLMKRMEFAYHSLGHSCQVIDVFENVTAAKPNIKQEPVAIIGMAVNMPGAPTVARLWDLLECGGNTLSMVCRFYPRDAIPRSQS